MPPRTLSEQWEALRPQLHRFRAWLGTPERTHSLLLLAWPVAAVIIVALVLRLVSSAKELADLISAFASLTWPLVALAIVSWFRPEFRAILSRIKKGKFFGTEFELDELQAKAEVAEAKAEAASGSMIQASAGFHGSATLAADVAQDAVEEVLREASRSPRLGLMLLSAKIERAARELAIDTGLRGFAGPRSLTIIVRQLVAQERLSEEAAEAFYLFMRVRNRIVHGDDADDEEVARAIDSGTRLLRLLLSRPRPASESERPADGS